MKILNRKNNLEKELKKNSGKKIKIVSAFSSGTEELIDELVKANNKVEIIVGTINCFSSPNFIDFCSKYKNPNLKLYVDFRYQRSIHWKLYLIEPNVIIIGSANFTNLGAKLSRDTCVVFKSTKIYKQYVEKISRLKLKSDVVSSDKPKRFKKLFTQYRIRHEKMQKSLARAHQYSSVVDWLDEEVNQTIPLFIWDSKHTEKTEKIAYELIVKSDADITKSDIKDFATYNCKENQLPFEEGDIVIMASHTGTYICFQSFDRIIFKKGTHYIYSFKKKRYKYPFQIKELKVGLKKKIPIMYEDGVLELHRNDIRDILKKC